MRTSIAAALVLSAATLSPAIAFASSEQSILAELETVHVSRGVCESTLKRIRNEVRQTVKQSEAGSGQTSSVINRLLDPAVKFVCTAVSQDGKSGFKITEAAS
jgi:hypothetical protein